MKENYSATEVVLLVIATAIIVFLLAYSAMTGMTTPLVQTVTHDGLCLISNQLLDCGIMTVIDLNAREVVTITTFNVDEEWLTLKTVSFFGGEQ